MKALNEPGGDRTPDPRIKSPLLYRLSYRPNSFSLSYMPPEDQKQEQDLGAGLEKNA